MKWAQIRWVSAARDLIPNASTFLHCLLQQGVQTPSIKEAVAAAATNTKQLETDDSAINKSLRMQKAATSQLVILVANGFEAQIAWAGLPKPFQSFQAMVEAAG